MKLKTAFLAVVLATTSFLLNSCGGNNVSPNSKTFEIYLDFWNTTGKSPEIRFDDKQTSREVKIDFTKDFGGYAEGTSFTKVVIDNFRIVDNLSNNYSLDGEIKAYEFRKDINEWKEDLEFKVDHSVSEDISVVMVLDKSKSLGEDFETIKTYANNFVDKVFAERKSVKIGIVDFADQVNSTPITDQKEVLKSYISGLKAGDFTNLYSAIDTGIEMLQSSKSQSRVLIVFTDGTDNMAPVGVNIDYLVNKIKADRNSYKINSFAIGFQGKGGVDEAVLNKLVSNGGIANYPKDIKELKNVFEKFSRVISNVYNLTYRRNQQVISRTAPAKLKFVIPTKKL